MSSDTYNDYGTGDYSSSSDTTYPQRWLIAPDSSVASSVECPAPRRVFINFIIANAVVTALGVVVGCRPVLNKLSCGCLGRKDKKNTIRYNWIPPLFFQMLANVVCGVIIHGTPGYAHVRIEDVMMLYLIRPRISLIAMITFTAFFVTKDEYPWMYACLASAIVEVVLQAVAVIWVVATGYKSWGVEFIVLVVFMFIGTGLTAIVTVMVVIFSRPYDATGGDVFNRSRYGAFRISNSFGNRFSNWLQCMMFACPAYIVSWCFFGLLISGAKDEWCPPKLSAQLAVWIVFPVLGMFSGVGVS